MKRVITLFIANIFFVALFMFIYYSLSHNHFTKSNNKIPNIYDYLMLATGIQSGTGITTIYPTSNISKSLVSSQLLLLIALNILVIYIFIKVEKIEKKIEKWF